MSSTDRLTLLEQLCAQLLIDKYGNRAYIMHRGTEAERRFAEEVMGERVTEERVRGSEVIMPEAAKPTNEGRPNAAPSTTGGQVNANGRNT